MFLFLSGYSSCVSLWHFTSLMSHSSCAAAPAHAEADDILRFFTEPMTDLRRHNLHCLLASDWGKVVPRLVSTRTSQVDCHWPPHYCNALRVSSIVGPSCWSATCFKDTESLFVASAGNVGMDGIGRRRILRCEDLNAARSFTC